MTLLAVERTKLFTTRSPWWCALITLALTIGFSALMADRTSRAEFVTVATTQLGYRMGLPVIMVLAALSVTTEYRFSTIRITFQAVPNRAAVLTAKAAVVAVLALIIGEISAFGSWAVSWLIKPQADLALNSTADWINVAGVGVVYALTAIIAVAVGVMLRHSAGAIALLLIYALAAENLIQLIPTIGPQIYKWLPFNVAEKFLTGDRASNVGPGGGPVAGSTSPLDQGWALAYFAAFAVVLLIVAIGVAKKRDA